MGALRTAEFGGKRWFMDRRLSEYRNVEEPTDRLSFQEAYEKYHVWFQVNDLSDAVALENDAFRKTFSGGRVVATPGVVESPHQDRIIEAVRTYEFTSIDGNNPYGENDFGTVTIEGERYYFKIDYFDENYEMHSRDKGNPAVTRRLLTIMRTDEY